MLSVGALNRKVAIQQQSTTQDDLGQPVTTWTTLASPWANVRYLNGVETIKADAQTAVARASIRIRRRTDVTAAMRVLLGATTFQIQAVLPDEQDRRWLYLACEVIA